MANHTDLFLFDFKFADPEIHRVHTGVTNEQILENLKWLAGSDSQVIVRIPLIPGLNDDEHNIRETCAFLGSLPQLKVVHILPYHDFQRSKYETFDMNYTADAIQSPSEENIRGVKSRLDAVGLSVEIGG